MEKSCNFYSQIPGFKVVYGGSSEDTFTTIEIGEQITKMYLNLELGIANSNHSGSDRKRQQHFGRIIFHTDDVDKLYSYFKGNMNISSLISLENEPTNAAWGERFFHIREPDGYQLSFAEPKRHNRI